MFVKDAKSLCKNRNKQFIVAMVYNGVPLSGGLVINSRKEKVSKYIDELSVAMVQEYSFWETV